MISTAQEAQEAKMVSEGIELPKDPEQRTALIKRLGEWGNAETRRAAEVSLQSDILKGIKEDFGVDTKTSRKWAKWMHADTFERDSAKEDAVQEGFQELLRPTEVTDQHKAVVAATSESVE